MKSYTFHSLVALLWFTQHCYCGAPIKSEDYDYKVYNETESIRGETYVTIAPVGWLDRSRSVDITSNEPPISNREAAKLAMDATKAIKNLYPLYPVSIALHLQPMTDGTRAYYVVTLQERPDFLKLSGVKSPLGFVSVIVGMNGDVIPPRLKSSLNLL